MRIYFTIEWDINCILHTLHYISCLLRHKSLLRSTLVALRRTKRRVVPFMVSETDFTRLNTHFYLEFLFGVEFLSGRPARANAPHRGSNSHVCYTDKPVRPTDEW